MPVYRSCLRFTLLAYRVSADLRPYFEIMDQLRRAALSATCNVAEGVGEFTPREKARFYRISRRSLAEAAAVLDVIRGLGLAEEEAVAEASAAARPAAAMLTGLIREMESRATRATGEDAKPQP